MPDHEHLDSGLFAVLLPVSRNGNHAGDSYGISCGGDVHQLAERDADSTSRIHGLLHHGWEYPGRDHRRDVLAWHNLFGSHHGKRQRDAPGDLDGSWIPEFSRGELALHHNRQLAHSHRDAWWRHLQHVAKRRAWPVFRFDRLLYR